MSDYTRSPAFADEPARRDLHANPTVSEEAHTILLNKVSWGAIVAGVVVALAVHVLITMLGMGIGVAGFKE